MSDAMRSTLPDELVDERRWLGPRQATDACLFRANPGVGGISWLESAGGDPIRSNAGARANGWATERLPDLALAVRGVIGRSSSGRRGQ